MVLPSTHQEFEKAVFDNAVLFTTCLFSGRGQYHREEHATFEEAVTRAKQRTDAQGRKAILYAIDANGRSVQVNYD